MNRKKFLHAVTAGFIATYVMTMTGFWQAGIGLPKMDVGMMMADNMGHSYNWGNLAHFLNGILLALVYVRFFYDRLPGPAVIKGISYGVITTLAAGFVIVPLVSPAGVFFLNTPAPLFMTLGSLVIHLAYGTALGIAYAPDETANN